MNVYELAGGDGGSYGPIFGPVIADEVGEVGLREGGRYLLLELRSPLSFEGRPVSHVVITPRYVGDTLDNVRTGETTVGIGLVLLDPVDLAKALERGDVHHYAVGVSTPVPA